MTPEKKLKRRSSTFKLKLFSQSKEFSFSELDPMAFAKHLTATEWQLFKNIPTAEFLNKGI
jgi:hypothetical protein